MVFTKILKPSVEMLRSLGIQLVIYMDDMLQAEAIGSFPDVIVSPQEIWGSLSTAKNLS